MAKLIHIDDSVRHSIVCATQDLMEAEYSICLYSSNVDVEHFRCSSCKYDSLCSVLYSCRSQLYEVLRQYV